MREAAQDPLMRPFIGEQASNYLLTYLHARDKAINQLQEQGYEGDLANIGVSGEEQKMGLFALGETMALKDERFHYIWWYSLRSEVLMDEEEED
jgi:hypothetical protein